MDNGSVFPLKKTTYFDQSMDIEPSFNHKRDNDKNPDGHDPVHFQNLLNSQNSVHSDAEETESLELNEKHPLKPKKFEHPPDSENEGQKYMKSSMFYIAFSRSIWLIMLLFVQSISSIILSNFSKLLRVLLHFFLFQPVLSGSNRTTSP